MNRGKFLTIMIVFAALGYVQSLFYVANTSLLQSVYGTVPDWFPIYMLVALAVGVAAMAGIWQMKKWGAYILAASLVVTFLFQLFVLKPIQYGQFTFYMAAVSGGIWALAIYRKWQSFS